MSAALPIRPHLHQLEAMARQGIEIAMTRAVGYFLHPQQFPLAGQGNRFEQAFADLLKALPQGKVQRAIEPYVQHLNASPAERLARYGPLAAIELKSASPIAAQLKALKLPDSMRVSAEDFNKTIGTERAPKHALAALRAKLPAQAAVASQLNLTLHKVRCLETSDIRKDEMSAILSAVVNDTNLVEGLTLDFGQFKQLDERLFESPIGGAFSLFDDGGQFIVPTYLLLPSVLEKDRLRDDKLIQTLNKVWGAGMILVTALMAAAVAAIFIPGAQVALFPIAYATGIGAALHLMLSGVILCLNPLVDDLSVPVPINFTLDTPPTVGQTFDRLVELRFNKDWRDERKQAVYELTFRWRAS